MELSEIVKLWEVVQVFHRYTPLQRVCLVLGIPIALYVAYLITIGRPPLLVHELQFFLLQDGHVRRLSDGGPVVELDFRLLNSSSPAAEVHNVFGELWIEGGHFVAASLPPAMGQSGVGRLEWDIRIPVLPKEGVFVPARITARMPAPGDQILVGAQFVSSETSKQEYLWNIVNEGGVPKTILVKSPDEYK